MDPCSRLWANRRANLVESRPAAYNGAQSDRFKQSEKPPATAEQIKSLIRSHLSDDPERFYAIALQLAAHEAKQGHTALAHDIRDIIDKAQRSKGAKVLKFPNDMLGLVLSENPDIPKAALVMPAALESRIDRIIHEYRRRDKLKSHGLDHRRKVLLIGPPGTGKTMTAKVLAHELRLDLHTIQVDRLVTKFMGETSAKLRQIFDLIQQEIGVYLFDEFDAGGGERSLENDVGEMRRVLNAFLQFIEQDASAGVIVAATNSPSLLDKALFRRFDDVLYYDRPDEEERRRLIENVMGVYLSSELNWAEITSGSVELSHAEITRACLDAVKSAVLSEESTVSEVKLLGFLRERVETVERATLKHN